MSHTPKFERNPEVEIKAFKSGMTEQDILRTRIDDLVKQFQNKSPSQNKSPPPQDKSPPTIKEEKTSLTDLLTYKKNYNNN